MEEYLTVKELSEKIKFSKQSLYNLIHRGSFILGKHYLKPTPKKVLFKWSEIRGWMRDDQQSNKSSDPEADPFNLGSGCSDHSEPKKPSNLINI